MTIRCSRCGCAKFFFTSPPSEKADMPHHHGAYCAGCGKPLNLRDLLPAPFPYYDASLMNN